MEYMLPISFFKVRNSILKYFNRKILFIIFNIIVLYVSILGFMKERREESGQKF